MDITQRVQILIGGDASQAKKVIKEVENEIKSSQARQKTTAGQTGTQVGDAYGRAFNRAQDRWLNMAETGFRRWGGRVGGIIADVLGAFDKVDKTMYATERVGKMSGRTIRGIESQAVGTALGNAASAGLGAGVGVGSVHAATNGKLQKALMANNVADVRMILKEEIAQLASADMSRNEIEKTLMRKGAPYVGFRRIINKLPGGGVDLAGISKFMGGTAGMAIGGGAAAIAGVIKRFESLAKAYEEIQEKQKTFTKNQATIDSINSIGDSVERTRAILQEFGKDGQDAFRKVIEEQAKLKESLSDTSMTVTAFNGKATMEGIQEKVGGIWSGIKRAGLGFFNWLGGFGRFLRPYATVGPVPIGPMMGLENESIDSETIKQMEESNLDTLKMQQKVDEANEKRLKQKDEEIKAEKELQELRWKQKTDDDKERELKNAVEVLKAKRDQTNATKDILEYEKALADLEEIKARKAKEAADARERAADAAERENEARGRELERRYNDQSRHFLEIEDRSRFGISDLAGTNSVAGNAARRIQLLESNAKQARLNGNHGLAEQMINSANVIRRNLGAAGILQSDAYGEMFPITPTSRRTSYDISRDAFNYQGAIVRFGDRIGYGRLQDAAMARMAEMQSGRRYIGTLDEFFAANNYIPVRPRNGG